VQTAISVTNPLLIAGFCVISSTLQSSMWMKQHLQQQAWLAD
jgi:hypothetical protein